MGSCVYLDSPVTADRPGQPVRTWSGVWLPESAFCTATDHRLFYSALRVANCCISRWPNTIGVALQACLVLVVLVLLFFLLGYARFLWTSRRSGQRASRFGDLAKIPPIGGPCWSLDLWYFSHAETRDRCRSMVTACMRSSTCPQTKWVWLQIRERCPWLIKSL